MSNTKKQRPERIEFISDTGRPIGLATKFDLICEELRKLLEEDGKRWMPNQEFIGGMDEIISEFLFSVEEYNDYDPTPRFSYDETGGEPPLSADERWQAAFDQKQLLHS
jgi:hypothetical protein